MELRGEIRAQFALTPEEAAELLLAIGRTSASGCGTKGAAQEQNRLEQDATMDSAIERMQRAAKKLEEQPKAEAEEVKAECGAKDSAPEPAHTTQTEAPTQEQEQTSAGASARTESAAQEQTQAQAQEQKREQTQEQTREQTQEQEQTSASASARTEREEQTEQQAEQLDAETPELAVSLLRQQFGIPAVKEDRDEEQQRRSMELNRAVMAMIREITRNSSARSLADLKSDMEKKEFIRRSLTLAYDGQKFEENPF